MNTFVKKLHPHQQGVTQFPERTVAFRTNKSQRWIPLTEVVTDSIGRLGIMEEDFMGKLHFNWAVTALCV